MHVVQLLYNLPLGCNSLISMESHTVTHGSVNDDNIHVHTLNFPENPILSSGESTGLYNVLYRVVLYIDFPEKHATCR